ncbi:right-handed parallel beta-helix repeat-containing protein [Pseudonocardia bannensis]|uniref:Right handed beta helix domain-containing protein n=1 Tax=Pseudonocardia bannensis TaxID=630973 RepID=A0A848DF09_9PSEU|nr:right-handed parallel beta-helix repeat-containing protein [Pseudonocardia bannensis]NMH91131.1 hypothetical protein [Pseudonocardia bannensis]
MSRRNRPVRQILVVCAVTALAISALLTLSARDEAGTAGPPTDCWRTVRDAASLADAVAVIEPSQRLCLAGTGLADVTLALDRSGKPGSPIVLSGAGAALSAIAISADDIVVQDLTIVGPGGIKLRGSRLTAQDNTILSGHGGILCECADSVIERNEVTGADGAGIYIVGEQITVNGNTISGSVALSRDADGIRFFGTGLRIVNNVIRDIKDDGYPSGDRPHTDCFQTYDNDSPPTYDVIIAGNRCTNVDHQCLIATGDERRNSGTPDGVRTIVFEDNTCEVEGSQAVLLRGYPHVSVRNNSLNATYHGVVLTEGSTDVTVIGNEVGGGAQIYYLDSDSEPDFREARNRAVH